MPTNNPRFTVTLPSDLFDKINDYRHDRKLSTQNKAVVALLEKGLESIEYKKNSLPTLEDALLDFFQQLNQEGQEKVLSYTDDLVQSGRYKKNNQPQLVQKA